LEARGLAPLGYLDFLLGEAQKQINCEAADPEFGGSSFGRFGSFATGVFGASITPCPKCIQSRPYR
jgi:hypothetical protein